MASERRAAGHVLAQLAHVKFEPRTGATVYRFAQQQECTASGVDIVVAEVPLHMHATQAVYIDSRPQRDAVGF